MYILLYLCTFWTTWNRHPVRLLSGLRSSGCWSCKMDTSWTPSSIKSHWVWHTTRASFLFWCSFWVNWWKSQCSQPVSGQFENTWVMIFVKIVASSHTTETKWHSTPHRVGGGSNMACKWEKNKVVVDQVHETKWHPWAPEWVGLDYITLCPNRAWHPWGWCLLGLVGAHGIAVFIIVRSMMWIHCVIKG